MSPALGAFLAGIMLAGTRFAPQIRADVAPLRVLFVTLFFVSVGMLADLRWMSENWPRVLALLAAILIGKTVIIAVLTHLLSPSRRNAVATAVCLAQVGEFSFVLVETAAAPGSGLLDAETRALFSSSAIMTMILTPLLVRYAPALGDAAHVLLARIRPDAAPAPHAAHHQDLRDHFIVVGYGPAGRRVVSHLHKQGAQTVVIDMNPKGFAEARRAGAVPVLGDASKADVLEHAHLASAKAIILTVPDHRAALAMVNEIGEIAPHVPIITRARYSQYARDLLSAGSHITVDEEEVMGVELTRVIARVFFQTKMADRARQTHDRETR